jgi:hypothetical protein
VTVEAGQPVNPFHGRSIEGTPWQGQASRLDSTIFPKKEFPSKVALSIEQLCNPVDEDLQSGRSEIPYSATTTDVGRNGRRLLPSMHYIPIAARQGPQLPNAITIRPMSGLSALSGAAAESPPNYHSIDDGRKCTHCGATETPTWRRGATGTLCNACGLYERINSSPRRFHIVNGAVKVRRKSTVDPDRTCANCQIRTTPMWRRLEGTYYCNACAIFYKSNRYHRPQKIYS